MFPRSAESLGKELLLVDEVGPGSAGCNIKCNCSHREVIEYLPFINEVCLFFSSKLLK